jgi:CheY-like chemotaxis protein
MWLVSGHVHHSVVPAVILAAEDDPNDAFFLKETFDQAGLGDALRIVSDGREAIDYLQGNPPFGDRNRYPKPTLLLLDMNMPRINGLGVLEWLQEQPPESRVPVFLFASSISPPDLKRAVALGVSSCLSKPFDIADWLAVVQRLGPYLKMPGRPATVPVHAPAALSNP